ncbi:MAG: hypothetical protein ABFD49_00940 [Armatimonadota bacterium]|nr:hypothetical protein [bacterium]
MPNRPNAKVVILRQSQDNVPQFYRCAARLSALGRVINSGDPITVYSVHATVPEGPVLVTNETEFVFAS